MTELQTFIEDVGLYYESVGLPRMAGRVLGYLMGTPNASATFAELTEELKASKGAISLSVNLLTTRKLILKFMVPGDRRSHYRLSLGDIFSALDAKFSAFEPVKAIMRRANELNAEGDRSKHEQIAGIIDFYEFMEEEIPKLRTKWEESRQRR